MALADRPLLAGHAERHGGQGGGLHARAVHGRALARDLEVPQREARPVDVGHVVTHRHGGRALEATVAPVVLAGEQVAEALTDHLPS